MTVWCGPDVSPSFEIIYDAIKIIYDAIKAHGNPGVSAPPGPDFHQFARSEIDSLVRQRYLKAERRHLPKAVESALNGFICDKLGTPMKEA